MMCTLCTGWFKMQYTSASIHDEHWKAERERKRRERSPKRSFEYFLFTWDCWVGLQRQHINDIELDSGREYRIQPPEPGLIVLHHACMIKNTVRRRQKSFMTTWRHAVLNIKTKEFVSVFTFATQYSLALVRPAVGMEASRIQVFYRYLTVTA